MINTPELPECRPAGADDDGEGDRVPAQPGGGPVLSGEGVVLAAPPHRELQTAVEGRPGGRLLHHQAPRQPVWQLERPLLPAACSGHGAGEEQLQEERLWASDAARFLLLVLQGDVSGDQLSVITEHGGRSAKVLLYAPTKRGDFQLFQLNFNSLIQ